MNQNLFSVILSIVASLTLNSPISREKGCFVNYPNNITCQSFSYLNLSEEFIDISNNLNQDKKIFEKFILNAPTDEIPENVFIDISFKQIEIQRSNLKRIHTNAFKSTALYTEYYYHYSYDAMGCKLSHEPPYYDFFSALNSLVEARELLINLKSYSVQVIPENAFRMSVKKQNNLKSIHFSGKYEILSIGNYLFHELSSINLIFFDIPRIHFISANAFDFQITKNSSIEILMNSTQLDENCLEPRIFGSTTSNMNVDMSEFFLRIFSIFCKLFKKLF